MSTFAQNVIDFHKNLRLNASLPQGVKVMNPYKNNPEIQAVLEKFYTKFFNDRQQRQLIVGINPGRLGAGKTGVPFTDTKRLAQDCGISTSFDSHEPSSVFVYEVIKAFGGPAAFYHSFYINSVCPLGFLRQNKKGNWVNCNYYDDAALFEAVKPFIVSTLKTQIRFGIDPAVCYSLGKKNAKFLQIINKEEHLFKKIVALPHPRYVVQYKFKEKADFIRNYLKNLHA